MQFAVTQSIFKQITSLFIAAIILIICKMANRSKETLVRRVEQMFYFEHITTTLPERVRITLMWWQTI